MSDTSMEIIEENLTPIQKFYSGTSIFITGGTGFLGKILIEKLLRSCPHLSTMYILARNKKGKNLQTRIDELFDDLIFDRLKNEFPKYRHKIIGIGGDCSLPDLGLSLQDRQLLINEIQIVFHVAATVRFDEKLKLAVAINVRCPQDVLNLAKQMPQLKSFVHVSTAYSNCPNNVIEERFYNLPIDGKKLMLLTDTLNEKMLDNLTPTILDKWPNTYSFTKAVAEDIIRQDGQNLPIGVFRPSIVISTYKEPVKAWISNLYGPTGVSAGAGTGVLRTLHCNSNVNANVIPVDMCVNSLIATAWEINKNFNYSKENKLTYDIPIYNYESSNHKPITWGRFMHLTETHGIKVPTVKGIWYYSFTLQSTLIGYFFTTLILHYLPALFVDAALICMRKSPRMLKIYKKIHKFSSVISYFCTRDWKFESNNVDKLLDNMTDKDKEIFFFDLRKLDWDEFFMSYIKGIRIYLIQDPIDTLEEAKIRFRRFYYLHQTIKLVAAFGILRLIWWFSTFLYNYLF